MFTLEMFVMLALPADASPRKLTFELVIARFTLVSVPPFIVKMPDVPPPVMVCKTDGSLLRMPMPLMVRPWKPRAIVEDGALPANTRPPMLPLAFVTLVTTSEKMKNARLEPDGTVLGAQLDAVVQSEVVPLQVSAATPAGDRQMKASKAAPQRFMGTGWMGRIVARANRLKRWSPDVMPAFSPAGAQELGRVRIRQFLRHTLMPKRPTVLDFCHTPQGRRGNRGGQSPPDASSQLFE